MASGQVCRAQRPNTWLLRPIAAGVKKALANLEPSTHGPFADPGLEQVEAQRG